MLDFDGVTERMEARQCQCENCQANPLAHVLIVEPIVTQLAHYSAVGEPVVMTPSEMSQLANLLAGQAMFLDQTEALVKNHFKFNEQTRVRLLRIGIVAGAVAFWAGSLRVALWLAH